MTQHKVGWGFKVAVSVALTVAAIGSPCAADEQLREIQIVMLGDSITKGVRAGVLSNETFAALVETDLRGRGIDVTVVNLGVGGERTDQAIARLDTEILTEKKPRIVVVMYGTNDSYVDRGRTTSRLTLTEYRENLKTIIEKLASSGVEPILMTPPCWGAKASPSGAGDHPNRQLAKYVDICREVAGELKVPLVDHYAHWLKAQDEGQDLSAWTTDQCHPNPAGHRVMAELIGPEVFKALSSAHQ